MLKPGRDLFSALCVKSLSPDETPAEAMRLDVGWIAWQRAAPRREEGMLSRWRFWSGLCHHFGKVRYFVQVDDSYHTASSVRLRYRPESRDIEIVLTQTDSIVRLLLSLCLRKHKRQSGAWYKRLHGKRVLISHGATPAGETASRLTAAPLPPAQHVVLDRDRIAHLPLDISCPTA